MLKFYAGVENDSHPGYFAYDMADNPQNVSIFARELHNEIFDINFNENI